MSALDAARWVAHACVYGVLGASAVRLLEIAVGRRRRR